MDNVFKSNLQELYLDENNIDSHGAMSLPMQFPKTTWNLVLSYNLIDDKGTEALFETMLAKTPPYAPCV